MTFAGELVAANRLGGWSVAGFYAVDDACWTRLNLAVSYRGVYRHGAKPIIGLFGDINAHPASADGGAPAAG